MTETNTPPPTDFIRDIIDEDTGPASTTAGSPNAFHRSRTATFTSATQERMSQFRHAVQYGGTCNLRMNDTDPEGESLAFVESIMSESVARVRLGRPPVLCLRLLEALYDFARRLIEDGKAMSAT